MSRVPDFFLIGAMKCMTSSLHEQLAAIDGCFMSTPKEPNFFSDDENYARGGDWYCSLFTGASVDDLCGESSTHYTKLPTHPHTVERLVRYCPDAKFVYVVRHPIGRLVSQYVHEWTERKITAPINEAVDKHPELVAYSQYARQLEPYLGVFGQEKVLVLSQERLSFDPDGQLRRVCDFLGLPGDVTWSREIKPANRSAERLRKSAWRDAIVDNPVLTTLRRALVPQRTRDWVKSFWQMNQRPVLSPEVESRLVQVFDVDLDRLGRLLGLEVTCATFSEIAKTRDFKWAAAAHEPEEARVP